MQFKHFLHRYNTVLCLSVFKLSHYLLNTFKRDFSKENGSSNQSNKDQMMENYGNTNLDAPCSQAHFRHFRHLMLYVSCLMHGLKHY